MAAAAAMAPPEVAAAAAAEVEVELFIEGKGPRHSFRAALCGWEQNRLDLEGIMARYRLSALYAFSLASGRGQRLLFNPRNGLSIIPYSGKTDSIIRLDGQPQASVLLPIFKTLIGLSFLGGMITLMFVDLPAEWATTLRNASGGRVIWLLCFATMIILQLTRRSRKRAQD